MTRTGLTKREIKAYRRQLIKPYLQSVAAPRQSLAMTLCISVIIMFFILIVGGNLAPYAIQMGMPNNAAWTFTVVCALGGFVWGVSTRWSTRARFMLKRASLPVVAGATFGGFALFPSAILSEWFGVTSPFLLYALPVTLFGLGAATGLGFLISDLKSHRND